MRCLAALPALLSMLLALPALAETRWLGCKYTDISGKSQAFFLAFDDQRNIAQLLDEDRLVDGTNTFINFQSLRTRFPAFVLTYNRNDGTLMLSPQTGPVVSGLLHGDCRRTPPPPGAPKG